MAAPNLDSQVMSKSFSPQRAERRQHASPAPSGDQEVDQRLIDRRRVYVPLIALVAAGIALRLYTLLVFSSVVTDYYTGDATRFIRFGYHGLFFDEWQPAGYPAVLAALRSVSSELSFTVAVQHAFGIGTGLLVFALVRRAGASRLLALLPAAVALLSGDDLFLEHAFLEESLWMLLLAGGLYAAVRAGSSQNLRWIAATGVLLGLSVVVRNVSLPLIVVFAAWMMLMTGGPWRRKLRAAGTALAPALVVIVAYTVVATSFGPYSGLGEMSGWSLYTRVGQFADCRRFTPPPGTKGLCERRPTAERPGPFFYYFGSTSPARTVFPAMAPADGKKAGAFARAAILHQPLDYTRTVVKDVLRYFDPLAGNDRLLSGSTLADMSFRGVSPDPANTALFASRVETRYSGVDSTPNSGTSVLETYQSIFRIGGSALLALIVVSLLGAVRGVGFPRAAGALVAVCGLVLLVVPPVVSSYDGRYSVPAALLLSVSAALGVAGLRSRAHGCPTRV